MRKINWEIFFNNSSTKEALCEFANNKMSFKQLYNDCWPKECKKEIKFFKTKGYNKVIKGIRAALRLRGIDYKDYNCNC